MRELSPRGQKEAGFAQPRAHLLADPCTWAAGGSCRAMLRSAATRSTLKQQWWRRVANPQIGAETLNETEGMEELPLSSQDAIDDDSATRITYASLYLCTKCSYGVRAVRGVNVVVVSAGSNPSEDAIRITYGGCSLQPWLPDGIARFFKIVCVWPFGLLDYGSATLRCKI